MAIDVTQVKQIQEIIGFYRGLVLDLMEQELGDNPNWSFTRRRLLKAFGDRGLEHQILQVLRGSWGQSHVESQDISF